MKFLKVISLAIVLAFASLSAQADGQGDKPGLFVSLTTDDTWAATKAIMFAHQKALKNGFEPVAIWLNVRGVYLADKKRASHTHGLMKKNIQEMLSDFIKAGGVVYACGACSKAAGLKKEDYIDGVTMGSDKVILDLLSNPKVKTLSW